jgi:hypothetical protein
VEVGEPPAAAGEEAVADAPASEVRPAQRRGSRLSPREIQSLLRAGKSASVVARAADVDEAWVLRWLPPIEAERERIIARARAATVVKRRLGGSGKALGAAVDAGLAARGVDPGTIDWTAVRRDGDPHWVVSVGYHSRGKQRRAQWRYDPETGDVQPHDQVAMDLSWTRNDPPPAAVEENGSPVAAPLPKRSTPPKGAATKAAASRSAKAARSRKTAKSGKTAPPKKSGS